MGLILLAALAAWIASGFQMSTVSSVAQRLSGAMYADGLNRVLERPYSDFENQRSGETVNELQRMRKEVDLFISSAINIVFTAIIGLCVVLCYAVWVDWPIALFLALSTPLIAALSVAVSRRVGVFQKQIVQEGNELAGATGETIRNIELLKSLGLVSKQVDRFRSDSDRLVALELRKIRRVRIYSFFHGAAVHLSRFLLFLFLLYLLMMQRITIGQFVSMFLYSYFIFGPMQELGGVIATYRDVAVSLHLLGDLLALPEASPGLDGDANAPPLTSIQFERVTYRYGASERAVVQEISFHANRGETIAFVGPSGAGKSTLVKLICGLQSPTGGQILLNGKPSSAFGQAGLQKQIGLVTQSANLFAGTIGHNLRIVEPHATDEQCLRAMRLASAEGLLTRGADGLDTVIGEGGVRLSGGERQRLAIARALLREPQLILFDEATSALDPIVEREIGDTIREISRHKRNITVVVTHRLATVVYADRIHVLHEGRIVEAGNHLELLASGGLYFQMWTMQQDDTTRVHSPSAKTAAPYRQCVGTSPDSGTPPFTR
jgi:ATP-binding cassette subfamily B protein